MASVAQVLSNLLSRDLMAPSLLNDHTKMATMDAFTLDYLGGATGLLETKQSPRVHAHKSRPSLGGGSIGSGGSGSGTPGARKRRSTKEALGHGDQRGHGDHRGPGVAVLGSAVLGGAVLGGKGLLGTLASKSPNTTPQKLRRPSLGRTPSSPKSGGADYLQVPATAPAPAEAPARASSNTPSADPSFSKGAASDAHDGVDAPSSHAASLGGVAASLTIASSSTSPSRLRRGTHPSPGRAGGGGFGAGLLVSLGNTLGGMLSGAARANFFGCPNTDEKPPRPSAASSSSNSAEDSPKEAAHDGAHDGAHARARTWADGAAPGELPRGMPATTHAALEASSERTVERELSSRGAPRRRVGQLMLPSDLLADDEEAEEPCDWCARLSDAHWATPRALGARLLAWDLDLYSAHGPSLGATEAELHACAVDLLATVHAESVLGVSETTIRSLVLAVSQGYLAQPFHNFSHGVYVLQGCVVCLQRCEALRKVLRPIDQVALCIAALGHDIGHTGVQNTFLVNSADPLALLYNDRSVLESMHTSTLFRVFQLRGCALFENVAPEDFREVRKLMIGAIMATDLANHFTDLSKFTTRTENARDEPWSVEVLADRQMAVEMVLHAADLSGPARPWAVSSVWADKVQQEFVAQVAREKALGLPESTFLLAPKPQLEMSFMKVFALPIWQAVAKMLPELEDRVGCLHANHAMWQQQLLDMESEEIA